MVDPVRIPERQLDLGSASYYRVVTETVPGNQVKVRPGFIYAGAHAILDGFTGGEQTSAPFGPVLAAQQRYDLVYLDITGTATILQGNAVAFGSPVFNGAPGFNLGPSMPDQAVPLAYVFVEETGAVVVDTADIIVLGGQFQVMRDLLGYLVDKGLLGGAPAGTSDVVTPLFAAEVPGGGTTTAGVVTTAPLNYTRLLDQADDEILHSTGARVYGRVTEAAGVWTLAYHYIDAAGAEQTMDPSTDTDGVAPTDLRLVGTPKVFSQNDPSRPLFPSDVSRVSDQIAGDIPVGTAAVQGKLRVASDGALNGADVALGTVDARVAAVKGRANAGAVSGLEKIVRLIQGAGISVSMVQVAGELRFTVTNTAPGTPVAPGGFGFAWSGTGNSGPLPFTPIGAFATGNSDGQFTVNVGGAVGVVATQQAWASVNTLAPFTSRGTGGILAGSPVTQFSAANVRIVGGNGQCLIWGV